MSKLIVIDQGHSKNGKPDPGASGNGLIEALVVTDICNSIVNHLQGYDVTVLEAPRGSLKERAVYANEQKADFFLSVHCNAGGGTGFESYIHPNDTSEGLKIAEVIHQTIADYYMVKGFRNRGLKRSDLAVLRETKMPAMLLENLFIDNPVDAEYLRTHTDEIGNEIAYAQVVGLGLKKKTMDYCPDCAKLFAELQTAKQALRQVSGIAAPWMMK